MKLEAGQVAVVTGAASGLGRALASEFADRGMIGVLADVEEAPLADAASAIQATGATALGVPTDVRSAEQVDALAATTLERFGRVDLVVNNAGIMCGMGPLWTFEENDWEWTLSVNLGGVVNGMRSFVPHLVAQDRGHVVNTASMAGVSAPSGLGPYTVSKHAVVALSETLAADLALVGSNVRVTVVCPGGMATNIANAERNRPAELGVTPRKLDDLTLRGLGDWLATSSGPEMDAAGAAGIVVRGIEDDALHVAPNGLAATVKSRVDHLLSDFPDH
jgi:NAD(P)-dependent dehydrogenase (short-subunit alcohol dehydrogenase family)